MRWWLEIWPRNFILYRAKDTRLLRKVAIKVLPEQFTQALKYCFIVSNLLNFAIRLLIKTRLPELNGFPLMNER